MFIKYKDINNDSGVSEYELGSDYIAVRFKGTLKTYYYTYESAGQEHVEQMKRLAASGDGLNSYIGHHCRNLYDKRKTNGN
ncbi:MAG: hypothetical protein SPL80_03985 [Bacilli bacterium]|nr:hypothetical protein [Bacilli bacterium]